MTPELQAAIENAYRVFAAYRPGQRLDSRVSTSEADHREMLAVLTQTPLRSLPVEAIDAYFEYIRSAHFDGGFNADEVRCFLPRALELIAQGAPGTPFLREHLGPAMEGGQARTAWPAAEAEALDRVLSLLPEDWRVASGGRYFSPDRSFITRAFCRGGTPLTIATTFL